MGGSKIVIEKFKDKIRKLKKEVKALYLVSKRRDVPWYAKLVVILVVGYALSPIDLIPDFIPIFGYLDDLILLPIGIAFAIRLIPKDIMEECRKQTENTSKEGKTINLVGAGIIIVIWFLILAFILYILHKNKIIMF
ncbi:MAG TPA: YkvA family protein [Clostridiaceae bacterium]